MFLAVTATEMKLKLFQKQLQNVILLLLPPPPLLLPPPPPPLLLPPPPLPFFGALLHVIGTVLLTFQVSLLQKLSITFR